jgi:hypothetical protein
MIEKSFDQITKQDIDELVANGVPEGKTMEYKATLPRRTDGETKEFLGDVSSFANASGGDLLIGVTGEVNSEGKATGKPGKATGIPGTTPDHEIRRLDQMIHTGISPRIHGVQIRAVDGFEDGPVILIRIPSSWTGPHMVSYQESSRFYSRSNARKILLDFDQIKAAFVQSEAIPDRIRRFRNERLGKIVARDVPTRLVDGPVLAMHIVPVSTFVRNEQVDLIKLKSATLVNNRPYPIGSHSLTQMLNLDGLLCRSSMSRAEYALVFRNGTIEAVDQCLFDRNNLEVPYIPYETLEQDLVRALANYLAVYEFLGVERPFVLTLSLLDVKGFAMPNLPGGHAIDRSDLILPEVVIDEIDASPSSIWKPTFDLIWQSCGFERSVNFDSAGTWKF